MVLFPGVKVIMDKYVRKQVPLVVHVVILTGWAERHPNLFQSNGQYVSNEFMKTIDGMPLGDRLEGISGRHFFGH